MITIHGNINVPQSITEHCDSIKLENYKVNTPSKFHKHSGDANDLESVKNQLFQLTSIDPIKINAVYFSVAAGAEPHIDELDPGVFMNTTFVIPVILPTGHNELLAGNASIIPRVGNVYEFDHTKEHSMFVENHAGGCVVIMATELR